MDSFSIWLVKKNNNYLSPASAWDSTTVHAYTVPTGKRWIVYGGMSNRNASSTLVIYAKDTADKIILQLDSKSAGTGLTNWIANDADALRGSRGGIPLILDPGEYVEFTFGTAQGAGAEITCVIWEFDVE